jgi:hypothetical protein
MLLEIKMQAPTYKVFHTCPVRHVALKPTCPEKSTKLEN